MSDSRDKLGVFGRWPGHGMAWPERPGPERPSPLQYIASLIFVAVIFECYMYHTISIIRLGGSKESKMDDLAERLMR